MFCGGELNVTRNISVVSRVEGYRFGCREERIADIKIYRCLHSSGSRQPEKFVGAEPEGMA